MKTIEQLTDDEKGEWLVNAAEKNDFDGIKELVEAGMLNFNNCFVKQELIESAVSGKFYSLDLQALHKAGLEIEEFDLSDLMQRKYTGCVDFYSNDVIAKLVELGATQSEIALPEPKEYRFRREEMSKEDEEFFASLTFPDEDFLESYTFNRGEALKTAINCNEEEWVDILLENGYDPNFKANSQTCSSVTYALAVKQFDIALKLCEAGGRIDEQGKELLEHLNSLGIEEQPGLEKINALFEKQKLEDTVAQPIKQTTRKQKI
ncbi:MAG TPA: hypothetical protein VM577_19405 [Anaerovoracaceae bacterium]|nr:hypothetical protein [Anaerovoracaceae bacterium]